MRKFRSSKIWLPILGIFILLLLGGSFLSQKKMEKPTYDYKGLPDLKASIPEPETDWFAWIVKIGGGISALVNLVNLFEKVGKWLGRLFSKKALLSEPTKQDD